MKRLPFGDQGDEKRGVDKPRQDSDEHQGSDGDA
jgi:hypothetical protein